MKINLKPKKIVSGPIEVADRLTDHYHGPSRFDVLVDWQRELTKLMNYQTPPNDRWHPDNIPSQVTVLSWLEKEVNPLMDNLTRLANQPQVYDNLNLKLAYRDNLKRVFGFFNNYLSGRQDYVLGIIRAGRVAAEFLHPNNQPLLVNMKRLPLKGDNFAVGLIDDQQVLGQQLKNSFLEIDEVFLASGLTIASLLYFLKEQDVLPAKIRVIAPFATQIGISWLLELARDLAIGLEIITARLYWHLDNNLYVLEDKRRPICQELVQKGIKPVFAGGDAGDLTEID